MKIKILWLCWIAMPLSLFAQTLTDGIFMSKNMLCGGVWQQQDRFSEYWEGTTLRTNRNMGTMVGNMTALMLNYGITNRFNVLVAAPFMSTKATAGVNAGFSGLQDLTLGLKYKALQINDIALIGMVGTSFPMTNYVAHHPFAIGTQSKTLFGRVMLHYLHDKGWTAAAYANYVLRSKITIDATNYFTDRNINSNEVAVPNLFQAGARVGYYTHRLAAEVLGEYSAAQSGFDIRKNDVMFPAANQQIGARVGAFLSYRIKRLDDLQIVFSIMQTVSGRNVGKATSIGGGLMYILDFNKSTPKTE